MHRHRSRQLDWLAYFLALAIKIIYWSAGDTQLTRLNKKKKKEKQRKLSHAGGIKKKKTLN